MISLSARALLLSSLTLGLITTASASGQTAASLRGSATNASGDPLPNAVVRLVSDQTTHSRRDWRYTMVSNSLGKFSQEGLAPGAYLVMLFIGGKGTDVLRSVQLKAGDAQVVDLTLRPSVQMANNVGVSRDRPWKAQTSTR